MTPRTNLELRPLLRSRSFLIFPVIGICLVYILPMQRGHTTRPTDHSTTHSRVSIRFHRRTDVSPPPRETSVLIKVDATRDALDDPSALPLLCRQLVTATGVTPQAAAEKLAPLSGTATTSDAGESPDWFLWARLGGKPISCSLPASASPDLLAYAVHAEEGNTLCLVNRSDQKTVYRLQLRLPRGVYKVEKLVFTPPAASQNRVADVDSHPAPYTSALVCLQGVDQPAEGTVVKPGALTPGQICLLRFTDEARAARTALIEAQIRLHEMAASTPGPAKRLRRILDEGIPYRAGLTAGGSGTRARRLGCIHRLILLNAQAESLHRNYQERHTVDADPGAAVMGALERTADALAETSAVLNGLAPQIVCVPASGGPADAGASNPHPRSDADPSADPHEARVTLSLANNGAHSVESVKLGLDISALPEGVLCDPDDPAFFGTLRPGQTVRATFRLRYPTLQGLPINRCVGDVSYFVAGAPAHLRPRPW